MQIKEEESDKINVIIAEI